MTRQLTRELGDPDPVLSELQVQTAWLRLIGMQTLKPLLVALKDPRERLAYEKSDGALTTRQVATIVGKSQTTVVRWWASWCASGIASANEDGHVCHLLSFREIGIEVPDIRSDTMSSETVQDQVGEDA